MTDITLFRGDDEQFQLNVADANGSAIDLTNYKIFFTVKESTDDLDAAALIEKNIPGSATGSPTLGSVFIILNNEDTNIDPGTYLYDIQLKDAAGSISTPSEFPGRFIVKGDVTRRKVF